MDVTNVLARGSTHNTKTNQNTSKYRLNIKSPRRVCIQPSHLYFEYILSIFYIFKTILPKKGPFSPKKRDDTEKAAVQTTSQLVS